MSLHTTSESPAPSKPADPPASPAAVFPRWALGLLLLLTLLGLGLRFFRIENQSFWTDEVSSVNVSQVPLDRIYQESAMVNNSLPTYFLILRPLVGGGLEHIELRGRWLSALAGGLSIPLFVGIVYLWRRNWTTALLAGLLLAINPLHIWYSQETRAYALMLCFGLASLLCYELARTDKRFQWWIGYVIFAITAMALHKTALFFPMFCGVRHLLGVFRKRGTALSLLAHAPILALALTLLLLKSYPPGEGYNRHDSPLEIAYSFLTFVGGYSFGPSLTSIQSLGPRTALLLNLPQLAVAALVLLLAGLAFAVRFRHWLACRETALVCLGLGGVAAYALISGFPFNVRYALCALAGFLALAAALATAPRAPLLGRLAAAGLIAVALWADAQWYWSPVYRKNDCRAAAAWLVRNQGQIQSWTALPAYLDGSLEFYLRDSPEILARHRPPTSDRTTTFPPVPDALILGRRHHLDQPEKIIAAYTAAAGAVHTNLAVSGFELFTRAPKR
jgi:hypothetical protein